MWIEHLIFWLVVGAVGLFVLFFVVLVLVGRFERRYVRKYVPIADEEGPTARSGTAAEYAEEAALLGLHYAGAFLDGESKILKARVDLYFSEDGRVMLMIPSKTALLGYRLVSRMADDIWLLTAEMGSDADHSGLRLFKILPGCTMGQVLRYHRDRIDQHPSEPLPYDPETLLGDLYDHEVARAQRAVDLGFTRWASYQQDCFTGTWRGAFRQVNDLRKSGGGLSAANRLAEHYKTQADPQGHPGSTSRHSATQQMDEVEN